MENQSPKNPEIKRRGRRFRRLAVNLAAFAGALGLLSLLGFANHRRSETPIHTLQVSPGDDPEKTFLDSAAIRALVLSAAPQLLGTPSGKVNLQAIHGIVSAHPSVKNAQVYCTVDGRCVVRVSQRVPVARILNRDGTGLYVDREGFTMPLSRHHTARVPVFTGNIQEQHIPLPVPVMAADSVWARKSHLDEVFAFTQFMSENEFMAAQVEHIIFNERGEMELIPRVGNHRILIGDTRDLNLKYRKLLAFYAQTLRTLDLNQYRRINLKYDNQVVCEKN
jgi:cell division protein FtsQ